MKSCHYISHLICFHLVLFCLFCSRLGVVTDKYTFGEVFGDRPWLSLRSPATAILNSIQVLEPQRWKSSVTRNVRAGSPAANAASTPKQSLKIFQSLSIEEQLPLSNEGYQILLGALDKYVLSH